mmetsp:Transcript_40202/g.81004  ORF Transcript_40202/g.81004 Transcript_40202/m.81004 type:complete len:114 (-) Transcript_40202:25-366(-)
MSVQGGPAVAQQPPVSVPQDPAQLPRKQVQVLRAPGPDGARTGIGINFARTQPYGYYQITSLLPEGMAARGGELTPGQYLWGVEGQEIKDRNIGEVAELIKGTPGSHVSLVIS